VRPPPGPGTPARIGPNALTRSVRALRRRHGPEPTARIVEAAGLGHLLAKEPTGMQPEEDFLRLVEAVVRALPPRAAAAVMQEAGEETGRYVLEWRIPRAFRALLPLLPPHWRLRVLMEGIRRHAWTFVGSGTMEFRPGPLPLLRMRLGPRARRLPSPFPLRAYYLGAFRVLLTALVTPELRLVSRNLAGEEAPGGFECTLFLPGAPVPVEPPGEPHFTPQPGSVASWTPRSPAGN